MNVDEVKTWCANRGASCQLAKTAKAAGHKPGSPDRRAYIRGYRAWRGIRGASCQLAKTAKAAGHKPGVPDRRAYIRRYRTWCGSVSPVLSAIHWA